jgi:uncharacterized protein (TIGR02284 family)
VGRSAPQPARAQWTFSYSQSPDSLTAAFSRKPKMRIAHDDAEQTRRVAQFKSFITRSIHMAAEDKDLNRDPITDEPGAHPVGTGVGAVGGAVAGAAAGALGGPVGMAVGGVVGAVVGGLAGKAAAEAVNPTAEEEHWRENYTREPYYEQGRSFDDYAPAYRLGVSGRTRHEGDWESAEPRLASEWETARAGSSLSWREAQPASRAAWTRVENTFGMPGMDGTADSRMGGMTSDGNRTRDMGYDAGTAGGTGSTPNTMGGVPSPRSSDTGIGGSYQSQSQSQGGDYGNTASSGLGSSDGVTMGTGGTGSYGGTGTSGAAAKIGEAQSAGNMSGDNDDVVDALNDLAECCKDGEYGFRECAEQADRADLKSLFLQRADDCRGAAQELYQQIRSLGGDIDEGGSASGALHRGWVSMKAKLSTYDDKAVLEECERGEDNALARYRKALKQPLPAGIKLIVERQMQGVQRNHDQIKMLRDQFRAQS